MPIDSLRRLSDQEINHLLRTYKTTKRQDIRDQIVMQYTNLVESVARRFAGSAEPTEDLVQEGFIGLITAVDGYNPDKGVKFSTYATHFVIGQIKHCLRDRGKIIKEPAWLQELNHKVTRVIESLSQELGRIPTHGEIAKLMGLPEDNITELLTTREVFKVASLDGGSEPEEETTVSYDIDRVKTDRAMEFQLPVEEKLVLNTALHKLKDLEQNVIHQFYNEGKNQTEIARALGISCNYVSHILRNATKKLRKILVTEELKETQRESISHQRSHRPVDDGTVVDHITRLYNRRYFETRLDEEVSRASRHRYPISILFVTLDGHQQVSRAYGTIKSEETLRKAAHILNKSVRKVDIVTRYDSQTFGLILPHTGEQVSNVLERMRGRFDAWMQEEGLCDGRAPINLLIGAATACGDSSALSGLVERAHSSIRPAHDASSPAAAMPLAA